MKEMQIITNDYLYQSSLRYPEKTAIKDKNGTITYSELESKANTFGLFLQKLGIQKGDRVAVYLDNSIEFIISIFAILKNAGMFVPLPYKAPAERIFTIVNDCAPKFVVTTSHLIDILRNVNDNGYVEHVVTTDGTGAITADDVEKKLPFSVHRWSDFITEETSYFNENDSAKNLAYIIYTSGSTGKPKGVAIRHESLMNYTVSTIDSFGFTADTNNLCMSPFYFDGSLGSIFCTLLSGGCLTIYNPEIIVPRLFIKKLIEDRITHFGCTPGLFTTLVQNLTQEKAGLLSLKTVGLGGETCPKKYIKSLLEMVPNIRIFNRYGPTETTVIVSGYEITEKDVLDDKDVPIGKPLPNVYFYAFTPENKLIEPGETGELYVGGVQVMEGYWNDPELTSQVLRNDIIEGQTLYKTGDLVTCDAEGNYVFVARADDMVKRYGYRIYLSEIEKSLRELSCTEDCAVIPVKKNETTEIAAFVVVKDKAVDEYVIKKKLLDKIPQYMIPDMIRIIDEIPYTSIGKTDKKLLSQQIEGERYAYQA